MNSVKEGKSESSLYRVSYIMNTLIKKIKVKKMAQFNSSLKAGNVSWFKTNRVIILYDDFGCVDTGAVCSSIFFK